DVVALVGEEMKQVEARLAERMDSPVGAIPQVGAHLLGAGGKRLRPLLAVLGARAAGAPLDYGIAVGCAAELIHTATLYHDDVVEATAGKSVGHDLQEGKLTLPVLLACEADPALGHRVRMQLGERGVPAAVAAEILAETRAAGGVALAREKALALAADAVTEL